MDHHPQHSKRFIIPIFLPHTGCPHRCIFCDQSAITGQSFARPRRKRIRREIREFLNYRKVSHRPVQISFYGGNFLGQTESAVRRLLDLASEFVATAAVDSIRFSTRPDTIDSQRLAWLEGYPVATVEIGAQSMDDRVLRQANRGHTAVDVEHAMALLNAGGYETGLQMMLGLPGDTAAGALATGRRIVSLAPDVARIYPTLVLAGSPLAGQLQAGRYTPLDLDAAVAITARLYRLFINNGIRVIRMGLQASAELNTAGGVLAGPYHPAFGQLVLSRLFLERIARVLDEQGFSGNTISIAVHPRSVSNVKGHKGGNLSILKHRYSADTVTVTSRPDLNKTEVAVNAGHPASILN